MPWKGNSRRLDFGKRWQNGQSSDKNVLRNIIFSYLLIMVVIVGIWIVSMRQMSRVIASQNEIIYKNVLEVLSMSMDKDLAIMERTALSIALSKESKQLLSSWKEERGNILQIRSLKESMASAMANQSVITNCFVYMRNKDYCIAYNTSGPTLTYYRTYIAGLGAEYEEWVQWMDGMERNGYYLLETEGEQHIYYVYLMPLNSFRREAIIFLEMSRQGIHERLKRLKESPDTHYELITSNGVSILGESDGEEDCQVIELISGESGWTYRSYVQNRQFDRYLSDSTRLMLLGIIGITVICAAALLISFKANYLPLKKIINSLEMSMDRPKGKTGEYRYVWDSFEHLLLTQKKNQGELEANRRKLKTVYLQYLLSGRCRPENIHTNDLKLFNLDFLENGFRVLAFVLTSEEDAEKSGYIFRERGIYPDESLSVDATFGRSQGNVLYYFLSRPEERDSQQETLGCLQDELSLRGYSCHICVSNVYTGSLKAYAAYEETTELVRTVPWKPGAPGLLFYEDYLRDRRQNQLKEDITAYIMANYSNPALSVEDVCAALGKSASGINKQLKESGCESVLYYINQVRVEEAKRIFREAAGQLSVKEVMRMAGYENQNTFTRVFRKYEGMTPSEYAAKVQKA
ncbi:MAG: helix-turn-helix transcriptional regulator [Lachnospiraceae bacterium]|nr:AraC family transcriptional regulator [uncultured Acetatifactor sp.]MCI8287114.1 helix-turn-helix transcriptional regulator [Lachnospiraceae bacterium]